MVREAARLATAELTTAVDQYDYGAATAGLAELIEVLDGAEETLPPLEARRLMRLLRERRWFDLMERAGDAFVRTGVDEPAVQREYGQALLDGGRLAAGEAMLRPLLDVTKDDEAENAQVRGLLGRAYKQMYMDAGEPGVHRNQVNLEKAARYYYDTYRLNPAANHWHGINTVALVARANRDRVPLEGFPDAATLAGEILGSIERSEADGQAGKWEFGTAIEACVALGRLDDALAWTGDYMKVADVFAIASTRRQLEEVWAVTPEGEFGALLGILDSQMLHGEEGMRADFTAADKAALRAAVDKVDVGDRLERILGVTGVKSLEWYRQGLQRSEGIALISDETGRGVGSGFLVRGGDLSTKLPADELFVLTNAHVVADDHVVSGTLYPDEARVTFEALGSKTTHRVELKGSSVPGMLDTSILRLIPPAPEDATPLPVAKRLPRMDQRVYIIGHPLGGGLSFSLQDNLLIDIVEPKLHYRAPTEPGSSGAAVFNEAWKIVAIHHAGGHDMPRLTPVAGEPDRYPANEGIAIGAIKKWLEAELEPES
jgi:S1-C subfamily serine protease